MPAALGTDDTSGQPDVVYTAMLTKLSGADGSVVWEKEIVGARHTLDSVYDSEDGVLFVTAEVMAGSQVDALWITSDPPDDVDVEGWNVLMRVGAVDGKVSVRVGIGKTSYIWIPTPGERYRSGRIELRTGHARYDHRSRT